MPFLNTKVSFSLLDLGTLKFSSMYFESRPLGVSRQLSTGFSINSGIQWTKYRITHLVMDISTWTVNIGTFCVWMGAGNLLHNVKIIIAKGRQFFLSKVKVLSVTYDTLPNCFIKMFFIVCFLAPIHVRRCYELYSDWFMASVFPALILSNMTDIPKLRTKIKGLFDHIHTYMCSKMMPNQNIKQLLNVTSIIIRHPKPTWPR